MSAMQSQTAVVTDIRKIEMRQFAVPEPAQNAAGSIASHEFVFVCARISRCRFTDTITVHARLASEIFFEQPDHLRIDAHGGFAYFTQNYANCLR